MPVCGCYLEVKDASVSTCKALPVRNHPVEEVVVEGEGGDGSQQPAVPCGHTTHTIVARYCFKGEFVGGGTVVTQNSSSLMFSNARSVYFYLAALSQFTCVMNPEGANKALLKSGSQPKSGLYAYI